jgi:hypothetical protein
MQKVWFVLESQEVPFSMKEGNILGHIVSKRSEDRFRRVEEIKQISFPRNKKEV